VRRFIPKARIGIFTLIVLVLWILKWFFFTPQMRNYSTILSFSLDLLTPLLFILAACYFWKFFKRLRNKLLWRIRRRLILAHVFIGAIPILLVIGIFYVSALLFYYQLSYYLISNQIGIHSAQIHAFNLSLRDGLLELMTTTSAPSPAALKKELDADAKYILGAYPSASIILRFTDPATNRGITYINQNLGPERLVEYQIPRWLGDREFSGLVLEDLQPKIYKGTLFLRSFVASDLRPDFPFSIEVSVPFDRYLLGRLKAALGQDFILASQIAGRGLNVMPQNAKTLGDHIVDSTLEPETKSIFANPVWTILLFPTSWTSGMETSSDSDVLFVELSTSKLMQNVFRSESTVGRIILGVLKTIVVFWLIVEIASIIVGIVLTKSITNAIHSLDRGTEFVKRGDFSQRVVVRSDDQLGALAASFNQMTEYVQHLVKEQVQKERLERELEIAKEVQERLFPSSAPQLGRMDVAGGCLPARIVSGDYYDFLPLGANELGLAVGDICGKGISAALLMSNLQATLRSNVMNLWGHNGLNGEKNVAEIVQRLNGQIYSFTSANKFASFFYAVYDDALQTLTYCNAGHNPPLYFDGSGVRRLEAGGIVVGVFPDVQYDQETIQMKTGDVFLAYTDGIVESINEYGEEFGENRLIQLVQENRSLDANKIKEAVVDQVLSWTFAEEREDDMTLIVAKILDPGILRDNY
jgi:sigma-B regulation protein RsbU (phosphoserine phosphatase)